jgi:hypothetical protein
MGNGPYAPLPAVREFRTFGLAYEIRSFRGEWPSLEARMAAIRDLPKLSNSYTTVVIAR